MFSLEQKCGIIQNTEIFGSLAAENLQMIALHMGEKTFPAGSWMVKEGAIGDSLMVIYKGEAEIVKGESTILAVLKEGDILGEMACLSGNKRSTSARAKDEVSTLFLKGDALRLLIHKYPEISIGIMRMLIDRLQTANQVIQKLGEKKDQNKGLSHQFVILSGPQQGEKIPLPDTLVIGRGNPEEKIPGRLNLKGSCISQRHAQIFKHQGNYFIADLKSSNGTRLNGFRLQEIISLCVGDKIEIGEVAMSFQNVQ